MINSPILSYENKPSDVTKGTRQPYVFITLWSLSVTMWTDTSLILHYFFQEALSSIFARGSKQGAKYDVPEIYTVFIMESDTKNNDLTLALTQELLNLTPTSMQKQHSSVHYACTHAHACKG